MTSDGLTDAENSGPYVGDQLSAFLEQEHFLLKVLANLVEDDGLHECRLVCRRWRDACGKLPVKLKSMSLDKLQRAAEMFPEAKTLIIIESIHDTDVIETHIVPHLQRLENLNHLSLCLNSIQIGTLYLVEPIDQRNLGEPIDQRNLVACMLSMHRLRFLQVQTDQEDTLQCLIRGLRHLANLTSLSLAHNGVLQNDLDTDDCVTGLRQLGIPANLLINSQGELIFPMLTGLTGLFIGGNFGYPQPLPRNLQSIAPYAARLQLLAVCTDFEQASLTGPSPWRSFLNLSSLTIGSLRQQDANFFQALQQMHHLTHLEVDGMSESNKQAFAEIMPSLTGLRSLTLSSVSQSPDFWPEITKRLTVLTQLTNLSLPYLLGDLSLPEQFPRFPKGIVDLKIGSWKAFPQDLAESLMDLTNLTSLNICSSDEMHLFNNVTPFQFFTELGQLKTLRLSNSCLDRPFLDAFEALTGLTALCLDASEPKIDHKVFCKQLSLLSNLKVLKVPFPLKLLVDDETGVPDGSLPKLRRIEGSLKQGTVDHDTYSAMVKAFPCLRYVHRLID